MQNKISNAALTNVMIHRVGWLNKWLQMQNYEINNYRSAFLCICYNSLRSIMCEDEAQEYIRQINKKFPYSLSDEKEELKREVLRKFQKGIGKEGLALT